MRMVARNVSVLALGVVVTSTALAWGGPDGGGKRDGFYGHNGRHEQMGRGAGRDCDMGGPMGFSKVMDRELTASQIETLAEARLIHMGNENLKVGEVKATDNGYTVSIVTAKSGDLVHSLELAKNGIPMQKMERLEQRWKSKSS